MNLDKQPATSNGIRFTNNSDGINVREISHDDLADDRNLVSASVFCLLTLNDMANINNVYYFFLRKSMIFNNDFLIWKHCILNIL